MRAWRALGLLPMASGAAPDAFQPFVRWLHENGAVLRADIQLGVDSATGLRGVLLGGPVAKGAEVFSLPPGLVLTANVVQAEGIAWQQCAAVQNGEAPFETLSPIHTSFALFLLEQRAVGARWRPYISVLPDSFPGFPLNYSDQEMAGFQASPVRRLTELDREAVAHDHELMARVRANLTLQEFQWARMAVKSRVFGLRSLSGGRLKEEIIALAPLADFVNHPPDGIVKENVAPFYDVTTGVLRFKAIRGLSQGEGLYWDYGFQSNRHSLLRYGFTSKARVGLTDMPLFFRLTEFPDMPETSRTLKLDLISKSQEAGLLAMESDGTVMHELKLSLTGDTAEKLLGHMRFIVLEPRNATLLEDLCGGTYCRPINLNNERLALQRLASILQRLAGAYGTSADDDRSIIEDGKVNPSDGAKWNTLIVRFGEKQVLRGFGRLLGAVDTLFDLSPWSLARIVGDQWNNSGSDIHKYIQKNLTALVDLETMRWAKRKVKEDRLRAQNT